MDTLEPAAQLPHEEEAVASLHVVTKTHRFYTFLQTAFLKSIIPHGKFLWIWTILRVFCAFLVGNFVPIQVSFSVDPAFAFGFILFFDIVAWVDLFICSRVAYYGPSNQLITSWTKTALHYMRGPFVLDFLGCLPLDLFLIIFTPQISMFGAGRTFANKYHVISCLRLNRMLQCYRLFVSGNLMKKSIFKSLSFLILLQVVPLMSFFLNVTTCLAVLSVCGTSLNGEPIRCEKWAWITNGEIYKDAPVSNSSVMEDPVISYIIGFYWVISSALCVGFGDIGAHGHETNRKIAITVIYMGVLVTGFLVSKLTACLVGEDSRRILIREKTKVLFRFLEQFGVPKELCRRAKEYYFGAWDKTKGIFPKDLFSALHPSLKSDVMKSLYQERLKLSPIFLSTDEPGIRILCSKLQEVFYPEGEFLFEYGDLSGDVYFIAKGLIATYTERGDIMSYVGTGSLIGEISCLFEVQRQYTSVAATDCEVYMFRKEDFLDFLSLYPNLKTTLEESCIRHYKETMEAAAKSAGVRVLMSPLDDKNDEAALRSDNVGTAGLEERLRDYASEGSRSVTTGQKSEADDDDITDMTLEMEGTKNLAVVEMDFGSAMEMAVEECERDPEFIYDPLRLPATSLEHERKGGRGAKGATSHGADTKHWTSYFVSFGKVPRDEMGLIHILQERRKAKWYGIVFHPLSPVCTWVSFYLFVTSLSCGLTAYEIAFHTPTEATNLLTLRICMEIFFVVRIFGNFHLGYYDPYGTVVSDSVKVIKRYICSPSGFFLDLVTTFPFYLISYLLRGQAGKDAEVAADIRGLQLLRVFLFARYLKETETNLRMRMSRVKIVKVTILLCFIFHFCACAWYLVACDGLDCRRGSWMSIFIKEMINNKKIRNGSEITIGSRYLLSLYYVTTAITFTGLSDITPRTKVELCSTITMIFTTVFIIGFLVGEMTQWLAAQVKTKIHFRHKLNVMEHHFLALGLSYPKLNSVRSYFRLLWLRCNGNPYTQILAELPYALRADITMKVYGLNIKNSRILGRLDDIIIRQLSVRVHHEIFMPGAHIIRAGAVCTAVYFIKKGEVVILDEKANMELCVDVLYENECFGEVKVLLPIKEQFQFSYVARLETEVGVLFGDDMVDVLLRHHGVLEEVIGRADRLKAQRLAKKDEEDRIGFSDSSSGVGQGRYSASDINLHRR
ncbi:uncharacterized protein LOC118438473 [Folsomia candida]|nr:uncharacterized protein LOC118438473 [Folsomia candida]